jgi:aspartyl-tRNA(Asn)/glutamyl-tRNA(Gln) amidotransferase subunit C
MTSSQRISRDEVAHVAHLARLNVTDDELTRYTAQLGDVLDHAADLEALDLSDVEVSWRPYPLRNVVRPDTVVPPVDRDEVLGQAPAAEDGQFRVPPVLGEEP